MLKKEELPQVNSPRWMSLEDFEGEIWKEIPNLPLYKISNYSRIKSFVLSDRIKIIRPNLRRGYLGVTLSIDGNGKHINKGVHRLMAETFIPNPKNLPQVNHKDENPSNNCIDNLEWCDQKYNSNYGTNGQRISLKLTNGLRSKVVEQYDRKGNFIKEFPSVAEVSRLFGFPTSSITRCCNGSKKYSIIGGYQWKYKSSDKQILNLPIINKYSQDGTLICSYNSVIEASEDTGVHHSSICQCFTGKKKSAGGFIWKKEL